MKVKEEANDKGTKVIIFFPSEKEDNLWSKYIFSVVPQNNTILFFPKNEVANIGIFWNYCWIIITSRK
jgi:hypothetical protein